MELREAIIHAREVAENCGVDGQDCAYQHDKLADWLEELEQYKATGMTPEEIMAAEDRRHNCKIECLLREYNKLKEKLVAMEQAGQVRAMPFIAMVEQSLQDGKMKPERDQKHNGRYAVVYYAPERWGCPLIDICGTPYNSDQAEARLAELAGKEREHDI